MKIKQTKNIFHKSLFISLFWIFLAFLFSFWIGMTKGSEKAFLFLSGYFVEKSLSVDNLLVFILVFRAFKISQKDQPILLWWGMVGAVLCRGGMIWGGLSLLEKFHWMTYVLGFFLILMGMKFFLKKEETPEEEPWILKWSSSFFGKKEKKALFWGAVISIELADCLFALDSIPAIFAITLDPFIVYSSNIFALLGLRSLYLVISPSLNKLVFLEKGVGGILSFVGLKMLIEPFYQISSLWTLGIISLFLGISIGISLKKSKGREND